MTTEIIRRGFESRLQVWAEEQNIDVSFENDSFEPDIDKLYLKLSMVPAQTTSQYLDNSDRNYQGLCQIDINIPLNDGTGRVADFVAAFEILYQNSFVQESVRVFTQPVNELPGFPDGNFYKVPVRVIYWAGVV